MHRTNLGAGQHREKDLRDAGQINGDDIALAHAHDLKNIGHLLDFSIEGEVGKVRTSSEFSPTQIRASLLRRAVLRCRSTALVTILVLAPVNH